MLRVSDVPRSVAWYQSILGFTPVAAPTAAGCRLVRDDVALHLRPGTPPAASLLRAPGEWDVALRVAGDSLIELLNDARRRTPLVRGPEMMPDGLVEFELEDPDGYRVCLSGTAADTRGIPRAI